MELFQPGGHNRFGVSKQIIGLVTGIVDTDQRDGLALQTDFSSRIFQYGDACGFHPCLQFTILIYTSFVITSDIVTRCDLYCFTNELQSNLNISITGID